MQRLEERVARFILKNLHRNLSSLGAGGCSAGSDFRPPFTTTPLSRPHRVCQRRFYDFNVWTDRKIREKLDYMPNNPVERRLVEKPGDWPWSNWRSYYLQDSSVLAMDRMP